MKIDGLNSLNCFSLCFPWGKGLCHTMGGWAGGAAVLWRCCGGAALLMLFVRYIFNSFWTVWKRRPRTPGTTQSECPGRALWCAKPHFFSYTAALDFRCMPWRSLDSRGTCRLSWSLVRPWARLHHMSSRSVQTHGFSFHVGLDLFLDLYVHDFRSPNLFAATMLACAIYTHVHAWGPAVCVCCGLLTMVLIECCTRICLLCVSLFMRNLLWIRDSIVGICMPCNDLLTPYRRLSLQLCCLRVSRGVEGSLLVGLSTSRWGRVELGLGKSFSFQSCTERKLFTYGPTLFFVSRAVYARVQAE